MRKAFIRHYSNYEGKRLFKGYNYKLIKINNEIFNLVDNKDNYNEGEKVVVLSENTRKPFHFEIISNKQHIINENTSKNFMVIDILQ